MDTPNSAHYSIKSALIKVLVMISFQYTFFFFIVNVKNSSIFVN